MSLSKIAKTKKLLTLILFFIVGIIVGGYLFHASLPRSFLAFNTCKETCLKPKDLLGLVVSVGITLEKVPGAVKETDKTLVINHPFPEGKQHFVIIPKKDIKDIASISHEDGEYVTDAAALIGALVREYAMSKYRVVTNGAAYQHVTYLHFHLISND